MDACILDESDGVIHLAFSREFLMIMLALKESTRKGKALKVS